MKKLLFDFVEPKFVWVFGLFVWVLLIIYYVYLVRDQAIDVNVSYLDQRRLDRAQLVAFYFPIIFFTARVGDLILKFKKAKRTNETEKNSESEK